MNGNKDGRIMANKDIQKEIRSLDDTAQFTLSTRQMAEYCQRIVAYLETEKRYREPIGLEISPKKGYVIIFKCKKCGAIRKNKAAEDDNMDKIIELSSKH